MLDKKKLKAYKVRWKYENNSNLVVAREIQILYFKKQLETDFFVGTMSKHFTHNAHTIDAFIWLCVLLYPERGQYRIQLYCMQIGIYSL